MEFLPIMKVSFAETKEGSFIHIIIWEFKYMLRFQNISFKNEPFKDHFQEK